MTALMLDVGAAIPWKGLRSAQTLPSKSGYKRRSKNRPRTGLPRAQFNVGERLPPPRGHSLPNCPRHLVARNMICSAASCPSSAFANKENWVARMAKGSATNLRSTSEGVSRSASTFSVSRSQNAHFKAEMTRHVSFFEWQFG
jgi:hypothetical protein